MRPTPRQAQRLTHCTFDPKLGVQYVGPLPLPPPNQQKGTRRQCMPPQTTPDNAIRILRSPSGVMLSFRWIAAERAWARGGGFRMAFDAAYLGLSGWTYTGLAAPLQAAAQPVVAHEAPVAAEKPAASGTVHDVPMRRIAL